MAQADIEITLHGGESGLEARYFKPGDQVSGTVIVSPDGDVDCRHLYVRLLWHTHGRGTRYTAKVMEEDVFQGTLRGGLPSSYNFQFTLPDQPWSFDGHYVSIVWQVEAQVDVSWARDPKGEQVFVVRP
jgi:hypothetical protein